MGEDARVEILTRGEDATFWLRPIVNGVEVGNGVIHVESIEQGDKMSEEVARVVRNVYRRAYRDGYSASQAAVRDELGISRYHR